MHFALYYIEGKHLRLTSSKIMKSISLVEPMMRTLIKLQMHLYVTSFITRNQYHPLQDYTCNIQQILLSGYEFRLSCNREEYIPGNCISTPKYFLKRTKYQIHFKRLVCWLYASFQIRLLI